MKCFDTVDVNSHFEQKAVTFGLVPQWAELNDTLVFKRNKIYVRHIGNALHKDKRYKADDVFVFSPQKQVVFIRPNEKYLEKYIKTLNTEELDNFYIDAAD